MTLSPARSFGNVCCWQVVLFTLYLLLLDAEMTTGGQAIFISALLMVANIALIVTIFVETGNQAGRRAKSLDRRNEADLEMRRSAAATFEHYEDGLEMSDRGQAHRHTSFVNPLFDKAARAS